MIYVAEPPVLLDKRMITARTLKTALVWRYVDYSPSTTVVVGERGARLFKYPGILAWPTFVVQVLFNCCPTTAHCLARSACMREARRCTRGRSRSSRSLQGDLSQRRRNGVGETFILAHGAIA